MKKLIIILIIIVGNQSFSQNFHYRSYNFLKSYTELVLARHNLKIEKITALKHANNGIRIISSTQSYYLLSNLFYTKAKIYDYYYEYDSSQIFYTLAAPLFAKIKDSICAAKCYINMGVTEYYYGHYDTAFVYYNLASEYLKTSNDSNLIAKVYNNLGLANKSLGNYKKALENFQSVIDFLENTDNELSIANAYLNIGIVYWEQKNYDQALKNFNFSLELYEKLNSENDIASTYNNIGLIYNNKGDTAKAILYYDKAIDIYTSIDNQNGIASSLVNKAVLLDNAKMYDDAELLFLEALQKFENIDYKLGIFITKSNLSWLYSVTNQNDKALKFALEAVDIKSIDKPIKYLSDSYFVLANVYSDMKNYQKANEFYKKYLQTKDSIFNLEINKQTTEIQTKYETEKKETQLQLFQQQLTIQQLEIKNKQKRIFTTTSILILILLSAIVFAILYIQKQKSYLALVEQNIKLAKSDIEKEKAIQKNKENNEKIIPKYSDTNLNEEQKKELIDNVIILMEEEKYYMNEQFTINDFAKELHTNRNYLSQIINEHFNTNFNNFVNEFRVKEARKMLLNPEFQNYTIEGIAKSVGFHSKATFNTAFKKFTGVTPSFFKNNTNIS
ncbi:MAG: tetratricopeptide repeat protein [Bacteroidales bacterium]|nr:tetratricopeptide repeat protein [Bacteroidales bacterium]